jgi:hypothetical protein
VRRAVDAALRLEDDPEKLRAFVEALETLAEKAYAPLVKKLTARARILEGR